MDPVSDELRYLLQDAPSLRVLRGLEQLDRDLNVVDDLSSVLSGGHVLRQNYANDGHLTAELRLSTTLRWEQTRLLPFVTLTDGAVSARVDLGVVVPSRPKDVLHLEPATSDVTCVDLLALLRREIEQDITYPVGASPLAEVTSILAAQGFKPPLFAGDASGKTLAYPLPFTITDNEPIPTQLTIVNRLLSAVGYRALWLDGRGRPRSDPYQSPAVRPAEWLFDAQVPNRIVSARVEREIEAVKIPNVWIFRQRDNPSPTAGAGLYKVENVADGPTSINAVGRNPSNRFFDAVDQNALVSQGKRAVDSDRRFTTLYRTTTSPFPVAGHFDVYDFHDPRLGPRVKVLARQWRVDLGKGDTEHVWEEVA